METFNEYQEFTKSLAVYNEMVILEGAEIVEGGREVPASFALPYLYPLLALGEEMGEVQGKIAKFIRKSSKGMHLPEQVTDLREAVGYELGDLLYQVSETAYPHSCSRYPVA